jgi:predicted TIM-barrel fold metal-dependent hydrolase
MKNGFLVMDSDFHMMEPDDLWQRYMDEKWKVKAPKFPPNPLFPARSKTVAVPTGDSPFLHTDLKAVQVRSDLKRRAHARSPHYARAIEHGFDPQTHVEAMDIEGVDVGVLYSTRGRQVLSHDDLDPEYATALARAYNDWAYDYCRYNPARLKLAAQLAFHDPEQAAQEARRSVKELGAVAVVASPHPINGRHMHDPIFEPLWSELERLGVPLGLHPTGVSSLRDDVTRRFMNHPASGPISHAVRNPLESMMGYASLSMGGVFERHPKLTVAILESTCGWLPWWLEHLDEQWEKFGPGCEVKLSAKPSDYFYRQCYIATDPDENALKVVIDEIGDNRIVVSTDYPHDDSLFPRATESFLAIEGVNSESKRKILWDNCARLYQIPTTPSLS